MDASLFAFSPFDEHLGCFNLGKLLIKLLLTFAYKCLDGYMISFHFGQNLAS